MYTFRDYYHNEVNLSFNDHPFSKKPKHVWVICRHKDKWLLTKHKERGLEFPGGKVEEGETAKQAAIREVKEETGAKIKRINYIGQYFVSGKSGSIIKNVYYAEIDEIIDKENYFETEEQKMMNNIPSNIKHNNLYSFIMKDGVLPHSLKYIKENFQHKHRLL